ncbi:MAG TPA: transposase family protein [Methylomirabilota bacterium]|nr:transposase family protein [Methylomirabilota bacterium]
MINQHYLLKHRELFQYVIGISYAQFVALLPKFSSALRKAENDKAWKKRRIREPGGGRKATLKTDAEKLFFILLYYKAYPTFRFAQVMFGFDKRNIQLWVRFLEQALFEAVGYELELPKRKIRNQQEWLEICPQLSDFLVDSTERAIQRPKDKEKQKQYYSGKKKHHTVKNQIFVHPKTKKILAVSATVEGKRSDKTLFVDDSAYTELPPGAKGMADKAYIGIEHPFLTWTIPKKKPKGKELSEEDKENNRQISKIRIYVEHPNAYMKHFNILSNRFRSRIEKAEVPLKTIAAIYNFTRPPT